MRLVAGRRADDPPRRRGLAVEFRHGLTLAGNSGTGNSIQRLYPLTDGIGSIVAVTDPSGNVLERYAYDVNGLPQAMSASFTPYNAGAYSLYAAQYASKLGWNWFYRGQQWVQTQPDTSSLGSGTQWRGLYVSASGVWSDPVHARPCSRTYPLTAIRRPHPTRLPWRVSGRHMRLSSWGLA